MSKISKVYFFKCAGLVTPDHFGSAPNTTREYKKIINISMYILDHPTEGLILLDTGVCIETATEGLLMGLANIQPSLKKRIGEIGKTLDDVKHVCMSHLHCDHFGQSEFFPNAVFHIRKTEWEGIHDPESTCFSAGDKAFLADFEAKVPNLKLDLIPDVPEYDIFGDGSVISIDTKGHTPGHQSFIVHLESGKEMFLTMDATHSEDELYDERHFINTTWDLQKSIEVTKMLRDYRDRTGNTLYICHDAAQWYDVKKFPEYYE